VIRLYYLLGGSAQPLGQSKVIDLINPSKGNVGRMRSYRPHRFDPVSSLNRTFGSVATGPPGPRPPRGEAGCRGCRGSARRPGRGYSFRRLLTVAAGPFYSRRDLALSRGCGFRAQGAGKTRASKGGAWGGGNSGGYLKHGRALTKAARKPLTRHDRESRITNNM
jgi:hypothetical protein